MSPASRTATPPSRRTPRTCAASAASSRDSDGEVDELERAGGEAVGQGHARAGYPRPARGRDGRSAQAVGHRVQPRRVRARRGRRACWASCRAGACALRDHVAVLEGGRLELARGNGRDLERAGRGHERAGAWRRHENGSASATIIACWARMPWACSSTWPHIATAPPTRSDVPATPCAGVGDVPRVEAAGAAVLRRGPVVGDLAQAARGLQAAAPAIVGAQRPQPVVVQPPLAKADDGADRGRERRPPSARRAQRVGSAGRAGFGGPRGLALGHGARLGHAHRRLDRLDGDRPRRAVQRAAQRAVGPALRDTRGQRHGRHSLRSSAVRFCGIDVSARPDNQQLRTLEPQDGRLRGDRGHRLGAGMPPVTRVCRRRPVRMLAGRPGSVGAVGVWMGESVADRGAGSIERGGVPEEQVVAVRFVQ